jgi:hypothetical protein
MYEEYVADTLRRTMGYLARMAVALTFGGFVWNSNRCANVEVCPGCRRSRTYRVVAGVEDLREGEGPV